MKLYIIFNPNAGKAALGRINWALDYFETLGYEVTLFFSKKRGGTRELARDLASKAPDKIVAAGGDGTINEVMDGLVGTNIPLGIIPFGNANAFALEAGIPLNTQAACSVIKCGNVKKLNIGRANDRHFMLLSSVGFDAEIVYRLSQHIQRNPGKTAYYFEALKGFLTYKTKTFSAVLDSGESYQCYGALISNTRSYGGKVFVSPDSAGREGQDAFEVCLFLKPGPLHLLRSAFNAFFLKKHKHFDTANFIFRSSRSLEIQSREPQHVQADGDIITQTPCKIAFCPGALDVILPNPSTRRPNPEHYDRRPDGFARDHQRSQPQQQPQQDPDTENPPEIRN